MIGYQLIVVFLKNQLHYAMFVLLVSIHLLMSVYLQAPLLKLNEGFRIFSASLAIDQEQFAFVHLTKCPSLNPFRAHLVTICPSESICVPVNKKNSDPTTVEEDETTKSETIRHRRKASLSRESAITMVRYVLEKTKFLNL